MTNGNPQNPQGPQQQYPQYPQGAQGPQYGPQQYPPYALPPKKKSVWPKVFMIGCGCLAGIAIVLGIFALLMLRECNKPHIDTTAQYIKELNLKESIVKRDSLDSVQIKELIYIGMPKDSVLITLGEPDEYTDAKWGDWVAYNINDSTNVQIEFDRANLCAAIGFFDIVPEKYLNQEIVPEETQDEAVEDKVKDRVKDRKR